MEGETPREEINPGQEGQSPGEVPQPPVPERKPATPEEMANIAFSGEGEKLETLEPKPVEAKEEKPFDYEAEKAAQEARYLKLNDLLRDVFRIEDGTEGDLTQCSAFISAIDDWRNMAKKREGGMSEEDIAFYFKGGKVELARRANILLNVKKDIKDKLKVIEDKKKVQDLIGVKGSSEKFDQESASI